MPSQNKNIASILNEIKEKLELINQANIEAHNRGEKYNIFEILGEKYSELAHSAFISNLLNPKGSHALGAEPLRLFLNNIGLTGWIDKDINNAEVNIEVAVNGETDDEWGRMDIMIKTNEKIIIIENKIYAGDQPMQLKRYKTYAERHFGQKHTLLYLTLDGHPASDLSASNLQEGRDYFAISYKKDILNLTNESIKLAIQKPLVREVLNQYRKTLEDLVGAHGHNSAMKAVFDYIFQNYDVITQVFTDDKYLKERELILNAHSQEFFHYGLCHLVTELEGYSHNHGLACNLDGILSGGRYSGFSFQREGWSKTITFQFTMPYWKGCYYGVHSLQEMKPGEKMKHFKDKPNSHYCYGNSYTNYKEWNLKGLISGEIKESIIEAIEMTIEAINQEPNKYIM